MESILQELGGLNSSIPSELLSSPRIVRPISTPVAEGLYFAAPTGRPLTVSFVKLGSLGDQYVTAIFYPRKPTNSYQHTEPPPQDNLTEEPILEQTTIEEKVTKVKWKKSPSGIVKELRRRHRIKKLDGVPGVRKSILAILKTSWLNVLLIFIPLSWIFHFIKLDNTLVFIFSFLAIVPLAKLLGFATEELSLRLGQTLAGLLNATLGNAVELIVAIIALVKCELNVVQSSLIGSILSNLLLVLGMCFFAGGTRFSEQGFGMSSTQLNSSLLTLSVIAVLLPAAFHSAVQPNSDGQDPLTDAQEAHDILAISHGASGFFFVAIILLFIYLCYLVFQLFSHKNLYEDDHPNVQKSVKYTPHLAKKLRVTYRKGDEGAISSGPVPSSPPPHDAEAGLAEEEEEEKPQMSSQMAIALLVVVTVIVAITAEFLVDSIDGLTASGNISKEFVGLILLPIVGNAAEHVTAVTVSVKNKLTLSLGVAVGSSIQIALFVIPFITVLGWILGKPLTLLFDPFESVVLFLAVLTVNYVVQDGKSNWLEGMILMCLYVIVGVTFWFYPGSDPAGVLASCT
ncbi:calcium/proton exchanger [Lactarius akahatsu]|uniref:Calcium/proton exchanger n=1 Tax=Lactarius akahatsu TaxID=416441 RepID=A0AAD4QFJ3_9AGAM|nr:calcium/proton exchanger [Lactarius akahatsu]